MALVLGAIRQADSPDGSFKTAQGLFLLDGSDEAVSQNNVKKFTVLSEFPGNRKAEGGRIVGRYGEDGGRKIGGSWSLRAIHRAVVSAPLLLLPGSPLGIGDNEALPDAKPFFLGPRAFEVRAATAELARHQVDIPGSTLFAADPQKSFFALSILKRP